MKKTLKTILIILVILILNIVILTNSVQAVEGEQITVYSKGYLKRVIQKNGIYIKTTHAVYMKDGKEYPVYCLDRELEGVGEYIATYDVTNQGIISDVNLWRVIISGYPYKSIEELGVKDEAEAYIATKQSIYCYLYNTNLEEYTSTLESGIRIINAMYKILEDAQNSTDTYENKKIKIIQSENWKVDDNEIEYISKQYEIICDKNISKFIVDLEKQPIGCKIVDLENQEKTEFNSNEKFKILIPITSLENNGEFKIQIQTKMKTYPVFFGKSPREDLQNYALTLSSIENINTEFIQTYSQNKTQIIIEKHDADTGAKLKGAKFEILNEEGKVIKTVETDEDGKINLNKILPGKYYISEIDAPEGYNLNLKIFEVEIELNQNKTIEIDNVKIEEPEEKIPEEEFTVEEPKIEEETIIVEEVLKLPVTGM